MNRKIVVVCLGLLCCGGAAGQDIDEIEMRGVKRGIKLALEYVERLYPEAIMYNRTQSEARRIALTGEFPLEDPEQKKRFEQARRERGIAEETARKERRKPTLEELDAIHEYHEYLIQTLRDLLNDELQMRGIKLAITIDRLTGPSVSTSDNKVDFRPGDSDYEVNLRFVVDFENIRTLIDGCSDLGRLESLRDRLEREIDLEELRGPLVLYGIVEFRGCPSGVSGSGVKEL